MNERPAIKVGDWITIGKTDCVVAQLHQPEFADVSGHCEVVHHPLKPSNDGARWNGERWEFVPGASGYADRNPSLRAAIAQLKRGRYR